MNLYIWIYESVEFLITEGHHVEGIFWISHLDGWIIDRQSIKDH